MKIAPKNKFIDIYFTLVNQEGLCSSQHNLRFYLNYLFKNISFDNKTMLDIGGGAVLFNFYAACMRANEVICLEPKASGSSSGVTEKFKKLQLGLRTLNKKVKLVSTTIQSFNPNYKKFDIILLHNSINHLDEEACINLQHNSHAIEIYKMIFQKMCNLAHNGAKLIITDCSRYNFFALFNCKNPFAPPIEWHKHQSSRYWSKLLSEVGFCNPKIQWISSCLSTIFLPFRLQSIGGLLLGNKVVSYFLDSHFCRTMEKTGCNQ